MFLSIYNALTYIRRLKTFQLIAADEQQRGTPNFPFGQDGSEERIAKILNEANKAMSSSSGTIKDMPGTPPSIPPPNPLSFSSQVSLTTVPRYYITFSVLDYLILASILGTRYIT